MVQEHKMVQCRIPTLSQLNTVLGPVSMTDLLIGPAAFFG